MWWHWVKLLPKMKNKNKRPRKRTRRFAGRCSETDKKYSFDSNSIWLFNSVPDWELNISSDLIIYLKYTVLKIDCQITELTIVKKKNEMWVF